MKIALLTPYTGGNLGDAAIQEAVISNIRDRRPNVDIYLITLNPEATTRLHGVSSFPITAFAMQGYPSEPSLRKTQTKKTDTAEIGSCSLLSRVKEAIQRSPLLYSTLKGIYKSLSIAGRAPWLFSEEIVHIAKAYKFLKGFSLLLVSGGGQLDDYWGGPWGQPYALFKWGIIARAVGARYVFLSVGTCSLASRLSSFFIRRALRLAAYRSYRDQTSKELVESMVFTRNDAVYPDLAFSYVNRGRLLNPDTSTPGKIIGVSPIAYLSRYGWPKHDRSIYEHYVEHLASFISDLIRQGYSIELFSTDGPDCEVVNDVIESLAEDVSRNNNGRIYQPRRNTIEELFAQLRNVDYVVASRLHGVLLSHLLCIPALAISYDRKVDTYMADMGLSEYCLNIHNLETVSLLEKFKLMTMNADCIKSILKEKNTDFACALERQYDCLLGM
jgi:polysaccharide pyruvyl transferase WcaK-like protein